MREVAGLVLSGVCALALYGQGVLSFEVVSIKPAPATADAPHGDCLGIDSHPGKFNPGLGRCTFQSNTLKDLISTAYSPVYPGGRLGFPSDHIELPKSADLKWISSQQFDIQAKAPNPGATTEANIYQMLQQLLTDDFKLKIHRSTKDVTGLILRVEPTGVKLQAATGAEQRQNMISGGPPGVRPVVGQATPIAAIVNLLTRAAQRPVQDQTGLTGLYNWSLAWAADDLNSSDTTFAPALVTAVKEQLGLRLEQGKVAEDILVVEYAEKPRTNANQTNERPSFEVASIKNNKSGDERNAHSSFAQPGRVSIANFSLRMLIGQAYDLPTLSDVFDRVFGLPPWGDVDRFDIEATTGSNVGASDKRVMLQSLLADRFKLAVHRETRESQVYAIVWSKPGKLGPQLLPHRDESCRGQAPKTEVPAPTQGKSPHESALLALQQYACGRVVGGRLPQANLYWSGGRNVTMTTIAAALGGMDQFDRPVVNQTGSTAVFDFAVEWDTRLNQLSQNPIADPAGPSLVEAIRDQLGLTILATKGPVEVLVIDHAEKPTGN